MELYHQRRKEDIVVNSRDKYFFPEFSLKVGNLIFTEGISLDYYSSKKAMSDWMHIRFTDKLHKTMGFQPMQKATFQFGYSGALEQIFSGYIDRIGQSGAEVICKDAMLKLQKQKLTELYLSVSQEEYLKTLLGQAGVKIGTIQAQGKFRKDKVMIENITYAEAVQRANTLWKTNSFFYFDSKEQFYFNSPKPQKEQYLFKYGESILNCTKHQNMYELEVIPVHVDYTNKITVDHPDCSGEFEVLEVRFHVTDRGFPKMFLYFEE